MVRKRYRIKNHELGYKKIELLERGRRQKIIKPDKSE